MQYEEQHQSWYTVQSLEGYNTKEKSAKRLKVSDHKSVVCAPSKVDWMSKVKLLKAGHCHKCEKSCLGICGALYSGYLPYAGMQFIETQHFTIHYCMIPYNTIHSTILMSHHNNFIFRK